MLTKHFNIFYREGNKIFTENDGKSSNTFKKVQHLENDLTLAFIQLIRDSNSQIIKSILDKSHITIGNYFLNIDYQPTDKNKFRSYPKKYLLAIYSDDLPETEGTEYNEKPSRPDLVIYNEDEVIIIEIKTQSPLSKSQLFAHSLNFFGEKLPYNKITWAEVSNLLAKFENNIDEISKYLINHFIDYLTILGLNLDLEFKEEDFANHLKIDSLSPDEYADFLLYFKIKAYKMVSKLEDKVKVNFPAYSDYIHSEPSKINTFELGTWNTIWFNLKRGASKNSFPNFTFLFIDSGITVRINAETRDSFKVISKKFNKQPVEFQHLLDSLVGFNINLCYKFDFGPQRPIEPVYNNYPKSLDKLSVNEIIEDIELLKKNYFAKMNEIYIAMKGGHYLKDNGSLFTASEQNYLLTENKNPKVIFRISKELDVDTIVGAGKNLDKVINNIIDEITPLMKFLLS